MRETIIAKLAEIEREEGVRIFHACESGSRAWGFPSADSDYDVRFLYARPMEWYLSINVEHRRDVIERPIVDDLDLSGWDIRKALVLLYKSNPPLMEWLDSPIIYLRTNGFPERMRELVRRCYSPRACFHHYLNIVKGNLPQMRGATVRSKRYFYCLRPLFACRWIERGLGVVPIEFARLVDGVVEERAVREEIERLLERKRSGSEAGDGPAVPILSDYIEREYVRLEQVASTIPAVKADIETLNEFFREVVSTR